MTCGNCYGGESRCAVAGQDEIIVEQEAGRAGFETREDKPTSRHALVVGVEVAQEVRNLSRIQRALIVYDEHQRVRAVAFRKLDSAMPPVLLFADLY